MRVFGISLILAIVARIFCGNHLKVISIEQTDGGVLVDFWPVLLFRERKNLKTHTCELLTLKLYSFQNLSLGFILKCS